MHDDPDLQGVRFNPGFSCALGITLCGEFVMESPLQRISIPDRGEPADFVDMETTGFLRACYGLQDPEEVYVVRAVSDRSEFKKALKRKVCWKWCPSISCVLS